jgi:MFS family permease
MAVTKDAPAESAVRVPEAGERALGKAFVLVGAVLLLLLAFGWTFLKDPTISAPTRDPAWYTWRSSLLLHANPGLIAKEWGPFSMFSGGYRVSVPLFGAILMRVAGIDLFSFSTIMMTGVPVAAGLALGAFAYRRYRDPVLFLLVMLATAALFMTTPYMGYLDDITVLCILSLLLAFIGPARTSWGARSAVFLFAVTAAFTHPTSSAIFGIVLMFVFFLHLVTSRFSVTKALDRDGPGLIATGLGMVFGLSLWPLGPWGVKGSLADAALPPPYTQEVFTHRLSQWVSSSQPLITIPLIVLAVVWLIRRSRKDREPVGAFGTISAMWLLPLLGTFGWVFGKAYPYYRFMNATAAVMPLLGLGAWVVIRWLLRFEGSKRVLGITGSVAVVGSLVFVFFMGRSATLWASPDNQWISQPTRVAMSAVNAVVEHEPGHPIVFIENFGDQYSAYGWAKTYTNVSRGALPGEAVPRDFNYFGSVEDFLAGQPTVLKDPTYNKMSRGFNHWMQEGLKQYPLEPVVFLVRGFNGTTDNSALLDQDPAPGYLLKISDDVAVVTGPGLLTPTEDVVLAAQAAQQQSATAIANHPGILSNFGHTVRVLLGLAVLLVLPGLIASRWFELEDFWVKFALIPGLSFALVVLSGILVVALTRNPFSTADGWISVGIATAVAAGLHMLARRRESGKAKAAKAINKAITNAFSLFQHRSFAFLLSAQFLAVAGDGVVQGSLAKAIAFGGKEGFSLEDAPSAKYVLGLVVLLYLPYTFVSPLVGVVIDRFDRRKLLVWSNALRAGVIGLLGLWGIAVGFDAIPDAMLIVALVLTLACTRMLLAIKSAGMPTVLEGKDLLQGNALSQAGSAIFQLLGAAVAVVFTKSMPVYVPIMLGAGVYAGGSLAATKIDHLASEIRKTRVFDEIKRVNRDVFEGFREVRRRPAAALGLTGFQAIRMELVSFVGLVFALEARNILGGSADKTAVYIAGGTAAVGAALGFMIAQRLKDRVPPERLLVVAMAGSGFGVMVFGGITTILGFSGLAFVAAMGFFVGKISADTIMQRALPDNFRGRGFSLFDIAYNLGWIVPAFILFAVYSESRVRLILIASGVVFLGVTALIAAWARRLAPELRAAEAARAAAGNGKRGA